MASRVLFRRLLQVNRRVLCHRTAISRQLIALSRIQHSPTPSLQGIPPLRGYCSKTGSGDGMIINIQNKEDFENRVINSSIPVVVDFHALWCGPCKLLGPRLEALVGNREGKVILAKVDVDEQDELAMEYMITSVPTVIGFKNKEVNGNFIGLKDDDAIEEFLDRLIG